MTSYLKAAKKAKAFAKEAKEAKEAPAPVVDIRTARAPRDGDERRLIAAGWRPKERCGPLGLTIWANPETGFYGSQVSALHRLDNPIPRPPYRKLGGGFADEGLEAVRTEGSTA